MYFSNYIYYFLLLLCYLFFYFLEKIEQKNFVVCLFNYFRFETMYYANSFLVFLAISLLTYKINHEFLDYSTFF